MIIDCKKSHDKCNAMCCNMVPIERDIYERNRSNLITEVLKEFQLFGNSPDECGVPLILPMTESGRCAFLKPDLQCNIYDDRPKVCRKYGDETHRCLRCPFQDKNGKLRSRQQTRLILREATKDSKRLLHEKCRNR